MANNGKRRRPRRGRHLAPREALPLIEEADLLAGHHERLIRQGFRLTRMVRPYLRADGWVTVRFTWRKRSDGVSATWTWAERFRLVPPPGPHR